MSAPKDSERAPREAPGHRGAGANGDQGVLSQLPRTRPQRSSPRRAAARAASAAAKAAAAPSSNGRAPTPATTAAPTTAATATSSNGRPPAPARKAVKATPRKAAPKRAPRRAAKPSVLAEPAPRQGFECEGERVGGSVHPPGGAELVASAA
jgi:hypothetical protein